MERSEFGINVSERGVQIKVHGSTMDIGNYMLNAARGIADAIKSLNGPEEVKNAIKFGFLDTFLEEGEIDLDEYKRAHEGIRENEKRKKPQEEKKPELDLDSELAALKKKLKDLMKGF